MAGALRERLAEISDEDLPAVIGGAGHDLAPILPGLGDRLSAAGDPPRAPALDAPEQRGARLQEGVLALLERLSAEGVICLVLEDLHHADPGTRDFVAALLRVSRRLPLALILSYHTDEVLSLIHI